jgi:hypothetical protein
MSKTVQPWGFQVDDQPQQVPLPIVALRRFQAEAAREERREREEREARLQVIERRHEALVNARVSEALLRGADVDVRNPEASLARTPAEILAAVQAQLAAEEEGGLPEGAEVLPPVGVHLSPKAAPAKASRSLVGRLSSARLAARRAGQRFATGTDERAIQRMAAEPGREITRYVQDSEAIVR